MMEQEITPKMTPGQQKIYLTMMAIAFVSCILLFFNRNVIWLAVLVISGITGFIVSRTHKSGYADGE